MTGHRTILIVAAFALAIGCAGDKGSEDDVFDDYEAKADSFSLPTQHGMLVFGVAQEAELAEGALYHAWDFALTGPAAVTISVVPVTPNLDTVMYLYRLNPETGSYGRYIDRNDDADGDTVASRISRDLEAGDYRVLVKGFKRSIRGEFQIVADCAGDGCATTGECSPENFRAMPDPAPGSCGALLSAALDATVVNTGEVSVTLEESCALPAAAAYGVELYYGYWNDLAGWEETFDFGDGPIEVAVDWSMLSNGGAVVGCDGGGDEAAMDFWFDGEGALVAYYQHNQSPDFALFCEGGEASVGEECGHLYLDAMPHAATAEQRGTEEGVVGSDAPDRLSRVALLAYHAYVQELAIDDTTPVTVAFVTWDSPEAGDWDAAGRVTCSADGYAAHRYELAAASTTQWLFTVARGDGAPALDCREL